MAELKPRLRVGAFIRVSSLGQVYDESPETHIEGAEEYAEREGVDIVAWYRLDSVRGADSLGHLETQKMKYDARTGKIDAVLFTSLTRLGRDMVGLVTLEKELRTQHGVKLISIQEDIDTSTAAGLERFYALAARAEIEVKVLSERVRRGNAMRRRRGEVISRAPYGFRKENKKLVIHDVEGPIRQWMFAEYLACQRLHTVAQTLNAAEIRTRSNALWNHTKIKRQLTDTTAIGIFVSGRTSAGVTPVEIPCPPLVSREVFDQAQALIALGAEGQPTTHAKMPYSGLLVCHCDTKMYYRMGRQDRPGQGNTFPRYFCRGCGNSILLADLDRAVGQILRGFVLADLPDSTRWETEIDTRGALLEAARTGLQSVKAERNSLFSLHAAQAIDTAEFIRRNQPLSEREKSLAGEVEKLERALAMEAVAALPKIDLSEVEWERLTLEEKREVLQAFVRQLVLTAESLELMPRALPPRVKYDAQMCKDVHEPGPVCMFAQKVKLVSPRPDAVFIPTDGRAWGYHLRLVRKTRRQTTQQAADQIGAQQNTLKHWESLSAKPAAPSVPGIVAYLGFVPWSRTPYQATLGEAVAAARELKGLTQKALGDLVQRSRAWVSGLEANARKPTLIPALEQILNTTFKRCDDSAS